MNFTNTIKFNVKYKVKSSTTGMFVGKTLIFDISPYYHPFRVTIYDALPENKNYIEIFLRKDEMIQFLDAHDICLEVIEDDNTKK